MPSANVNSKCGIVFPTVVPTSGWSIITGIAGAVLRLFSDSSVAAGVAVGDRVGRDSVAEVPQANNPITTAVNAEAINRDISG